MDSEADAAVDGQCGQAPFALEHLPHNALATVLHKAGLHTRLVCRAFHAAHPPLLTLAPHGLPTPDALTAALAALPPSLTALDLRHIDAWRDAPITPAHLATICSSLTRLQRLLLPPPLKPEHLPALHQGTAGLPHLHTLLAPALDSRNPADTSWPLDHPPLATRLRSLSLPPSSTPALLRAPPGALPSLTALTIRDLDPGVHCSGDLAPLAAAAPALRSLQLPRLLAHDDAPLAALSALSALTALIVPHITFPNEQPPARLLHHIGSALPALRSLSLALHHYGWTPAEAGWLSRLTQLTQLALALQHKRAEAEGMDVYLPPPAVAPWAHQLQPSEGGADPVPVPALVITSVVRDAARLPLLTDLTLSYTDTRPSNVSEFAALEKWFAYGTAHSFLRHLAAATQLRRLRLYLPYPPDEAQLLGGLPHLTCLAHTVECVNFLDPATQPSSHEAGLSWVTALRGLRELAIDHKCGTGYPDVVSSPLRVLAPSLTGLHTLSLRHLVRGHDLAAVLESLQGTLVRLDLGGMSSSYLRDLRALGDMRSLRALDLYSGPLGCRLDWFKPHLRLPGSLRCCWLDAWGTGPGILYERGLEVVEGWRRQYPLVAFCLFPRPAPDVW